MKRSYIWLAVACAGALPLAGCIQHGYTRTGVGVAIGWHSYPYSVWYDNYYGPIYDGYWGTDGYFYFRLFSTDRDWRRGDTRHFYRQPQPNWQRDRFRQVQGQTHQPLPNARMPNYPGSSARPGRDRDRD